MCRSVISHFSLLSAHLSEIAQQRCQTADDRFPGYRRARCLLHSRFYCQHDLLHMLQYFRTILPVECCKPTCYCTYSRTAYSVYTYVQYPMQESHRPLTACTVFEGKLFQVMDASTSIYWLQEAIETMSWTFFNFHAFVEEK